MSIRVEAYTRGDGTKVSEHIRQAGSSLRDAAEVGAGQAKGFAQTFSRNAEWNEKVGLAVSSGMAVASGQLAFAYRANPTIAMAYGAYALMMGIQSGMGAKKVVDRDKVDKSLDDDAKSAVETLADSVDMDPGDFLDKFGNWLRENDIEPEDVDEEVVTNFMVYCSKVTKGVGDTSSGSPYAHGMDDLRIEGEISKVDDDLGQVFGWASITEVNGEPVVDLQGDVMETYELEKAAYDYVLKSRVGGEMHERLEKSAPKQVGTLIESMVMTDEKVEKMGLPPETPRGWWVGFQVDKDDIGKAAWESVKDGKYTGFSIHGLGKRMEYDPVKKSVAQRSEEEIKGWVKRMAQTVGVPEEAFAEALMEHLTETDNESPSDEDLHEFIVQTYGSGEMSVKQQDVKKFLIAKASERAANSMEFADNVAEIAKSLESHDPDLAAYFDDVHKHLIGRHQQDDHDPTKKGKRSHKRGDHGTDKDPGKLSDTQRRSRLNPVAAAINPLAAASALNGTSIMWGNNWGRNMPFMDNRQVFESDTAAGAARGFVGGGPIGAPIGAGLGAWSERRRQARGDGSTRTFQNSERGDSRKLSKRQVEVLSKYLGKDAL